MIISDIPISCPFCKPNSAGQHEHGCPNNPDVILHSQSPVPGTFTACGNCQATRDLNAVKDELTAVKLNYGECQNALEYARVRIHAQETTYQQQLAYALTQEQGLRLQIEAMKCCWNCGWAVDGHRQCTGCVEAKTGGVRMCSACKRGCALCNNFNQWKEKGSAMIAKVID